ncbi:MAG: type III secretion system ATPase SctN [Betaproteobacteria bacterium]|nr:type III secretion system ATPase SctN [Betaproteobacteria bacterium]
MDAADAGLANPLELFVEKINRRIEAMPVQRMTGMVDEVVGTLVKAHVPSVRIGEICHLRDASGTLLSEAEVVGFVGDTVLLSLYRDTIGISTHTEVIPTGQTQEIAVGEQMLGRVLNAMGEPMDLDSKGPLLTTELRPIQTDAPDPLTRQIIAKPMPLGVRSIDGLLTVGEGQRIGIFAAAGGGKSTLLSSIVLGAEVDVVVISLIGERGREVREFIEHNLGEEGMRRSVLVISTSDRSSVERARSAYVATAIAEFFRDRGRKVLLMMDSVTRFARALREIGLAAGEPPTRRGFPPSVFTALPRLMERAGMGAVGSITAIYTVLVEGDDMTEPVADETRSILDGHVILSRKLAAANHYPAIAVLDSASRVMGNVTSDEHLKAAGQVRQYLAAYAAAELLIKVGEYSKGSDATTDKAIEKIDALNAYLRQDTREIEKFEDTVSKLKALAS